jgi:hypothetical protein
MKNLLYPERLRDNNANGSDIKIEISLKDNVPKIFLLKVFNPLNRCIVFQYEIPCIITTISERVHIVKLCIIIDPLE